MVIPSSLAIGASLRARRAGQLYARAAKKLFRASGALYRGLAAEQRALVNAQRAGTYPEAAKAYKSLQASLGGSIERVCVALGNPPGAPAKPRKSP